VLTCPVSFTNEFTENGANVFFSATATDNCDLNPAVDCTPASGSHFGLGVTLVSCTATDVSGNTSAACSFSVTVLDTTAPAMTCANITAACTGPDGANVSFTPTVLEVCDPSPTVICTPASGSLFAFGPTAVNCTVYDASLNTNTCSFTVTVTGSPAPTMTIVQSGTNVIISWPATCVPYELEKAVNLSNWSPSDSTIVLSGSTHYSTNAITGSTYYRLHKP